jgi:hypothetical protein
MQQSRHISLSLTSKLVVGLAIFLLWLTILGILTSAKTSALSGSSFDAGRIIDDAVFYDNNAMGVSEIQQFLNSKVPTCDTSGEEWHWTGRTRAEHGTANGVPPPYICLKDYTQSVPAITNGGSDLCTGSITAGTKSSAQIIFDAAQACGVSPKVLLVLLQKEQSLITDDWPWPIQYRSATGYGCPDTAPCDAEFYGFFNQVYQAAKAYKRYRANSTNYNYRAGRDNTILWHPNSACGTSSVYIQNQATAGLYIYTPYRPNQAALNNLYGTGDSCSSYGNRNFWRIFNDWFGNTTGPHYAWSIESFSYSGGDNYIIQGQTETVTLRARNIGRVPWYNHGDHPIRLGTWEPVDRFSSLLGGRIRLATLTENVVQPNEIGTFTFQITPSSVGVFEESLNLVAENYAWFSWPGLRPTIHVPTAYNWQVQSINYDTGTGYMEPGTQQLVTVIAKNIGSATWSKLSGPAIKLATWTPDRKSAVSQTWLSPTRVTLMNEDTVAPGQTAGFQFYVTMPASGQYYEKLNLVAEGISWFNNTNLTLYLEAKSYAWQPVWHSHSTGTANISRNTEFTLTVKAKNTGTMTWHKSQGFPVRLATVAPQDRGSGLFHTSWLRDTRPAALVENTVLPGQEGTFTFTAKTPPTPGARQERFSLVAEGISWFNDPNFNIYVNVL